jgi:hypothetical protein
MDDQPSDDESGESGEGPFAIDPGAPRLARMESYLVGGQAHFAADRAAVESIGDVSMGGFEGLRALITTTKGFVDRAVTLLATDLGVRQYLHIGMATPTDGMVHHIAAKAAPGARVVYASYDPTVLAHVHSLGHDVTEGEVTVAHVQSAFEDMRPILTEAATVLDLALPVAVVLPTTLNLIADDEVAQRIMDDLRDAVVAGSYVVFAHTSLDLAPPGTERAIERFNDLLDESYVVRSEARIAGLLDGFELLEPGLVPADHWRPGDPGAVQRRPMPIYGAVGRRP